MKTKKQVRNSTLQSLCCELLAKIQRIAKKYKLDDFIHNIIIDNKNGKCKATEKEVEMLARIVNEDRIARVEVPHILGKTYNECHDKDLFGKIRKIKNRSCYSRVSTILFSSEIKYDELKRENRNKRQRKRKLKEKYI